jgi:hypothetical protein
LSLLADAGILESNLRLVSADDAIVARFLNDDDEDGSMTDILPLSVGAVEPLSSGAAWGDV